MVHSFLKPKLDGRKKTDIQVNLNMGLRSDVLLAHLHKFNDFFFCRITLHMQDLQLAHGTYRERLLLSQKNGKICNCLESCNNIWGK